jgi:HSP20 family protein
MTVLTTSGKIFPSVLERYFDGDIQKGDTRGTLPAVNVIENGDGFTIEVAAPGLKKDDFKINFDKGRLTISAQTEQNREEEKYSFSRKEFNYGSFERTFTVSEKVVDGEKIEAGYADGILRIQLPKREEVKPKPAREIQVS